MRPDFPKRVLCAVDFSAPSAAAAKLAAAIAGRCGAELYAVYVDTIDAPLYFTPDMVPELEAQHQRSTSLLHSALKQFLAREGGPVHFDTRVSDGDPATAIVEAAAEISTDLIAMGTHARTGLDRFTVGSVARQVLRDANVPVLTVRDGQAPFDGRAVLAPVTDSAASRAAFRAGARMASCLDSELIVLHVREDRPEAAPPDICAWAADADLPKCRLREVLKAGPVREQIMSTVEENGAGLLVIGSRHGWAADRTDVGATAGWIIRHSPCPVLTVASGTQREVAAR